MRLILAFAVVVVHYEVSHHFTRFAGSSAVEVFFVLSGFIISLAFTRNYGNKLYLSFLASRYLRLFPTYAISVLLAGALFMLLLNIRGSEDMADWNLHGLYNYFVNFGQHSLGFHLSSWFIFLQDFLAISPEAQANLPNRVGWSIAAELSFYILTPVLLAMPIWLLVVATVVAFVVKGYILGTYGFAQAYFPFYAQIGFYCFGVLLFQLRSVIALKNRNWHRVSVGVFILLIFVLQDAYFERNIWQMWIWMIAIVPVMLTYGGERPDGMERLCGDLSYAVYLFHFPIGVAIYGLNPTRILSLSADGEQLCNAIIAMLLTLGLSVAVEFLVQRPLDSYRRQRFRREEG